MLPCFEIKNTEHALQAIRHACANASGCEHTPALSLQFKLPGQFHAMSLVAQGAMALPLSSSFSWQGDLMHEKVALMTTSWADAHWRVASTTVKKVRGDYLLEVKYEAPGVREDALVRIFTETIWKETTKTWKPVGVTISPDFPSEVVVLWWKRPQPSWIQTPETSIPPPWVSESSPSTTQQDLQDAAHAHLAAAATAMTLAQSRTRVLHERLAAPLGASSGEDEDTTEESLVKRRRHG